MRREIERQRELHAESDKHYRYKQTKSKSNSVGKSYGESEK